MILLLSFYAYKLIDMAREDNGRLKPFVVFIFKLYNSDCINDLCRIFTLSTNSKYSRWKCRGNNWMPLTKPFTSLFQTTETQFQTPAIQFQIFVIKFQTLAIGFQCNALEFQSYAI